MALSNENEEMHLTPSGWVQGSTRLDFNRRTAVEPPADRLLTIYRSVYVAAIGAKPDISQREVYRSGDEEAVRKALQKYGEPQFQV